jgi:hypothetical protein
VSSTIDSPIHEIKRVAHAAARRSAARMTDVIIYGPEYTVFVVLALESEPVDPRL